MDIDKLQTFMEVARTESFRTAADNLFLSPGAVSKHISYLESEFSITLFHRFSKGVALTAQGKIFAKYAKPLVDDYELLRQAVFCQEEKDTVCVRTIPNKDMLGFFDLISAFEKAYPNISLNLQDIQGTEATSVLANGKSEIVFCMDQYLDPHLTEYKNLHESTLMLLVCAEHPLAQRENVSVLELAQESFISLPEITGIASTVTRFCKNAGFDYKVSCYSERESNILTMVSMNKGIAIVDPSYFRSDFVNYYGRANVTGIPLKEHFTWNLVMAKSRNMILKPAAQKFWDFTLSQVKRKQWPAFE
ncbi:HTH-type transcriptional regulator gltC [uncultured Roseburia sp.]|uniref:LysR family transcriptional regulator n=1 Tax=Brotonthovivens ammoniilytica TaxID=2981725 RepID=A0ABT2TIK1_9FIRM|nr:LysR family transcriptional regulator [Brotonthovivens ammoniilytica]MCU6762053.1 LysR family transcriptional regulator [Brotonthovivens ammoniilytica]SCI54219.1 HTH-type transcriptional regulator gltC [uncultured Roseburia sp.]